VSEKAFAQVRHPGIELRFVNHRLTLAAATTARIRRSAAAAKMASGRCRPRAGNRRAAGADIKRPRMDSRSAAMPICGSPICSCGGVRSMSRHPKPGPALRRRPDCSFAAAHFEPLPIVLACDREETTMGDKVTRRARLVGSSTSATASGLVSANAIRADTR
jgi:hypothetical protein